MIEHSLNTHPANALALSSTHDYLDNGLHVCGLRVPAAFPRSLHE